MLDRSSRAETAEQNSDGEGSESSEETSELWTLYKAVRSYTTNLGICLSEPFLRLPSKRFVCAMAPLHRGGAATHAPTLNGC